MSSAPDLLQQIRSNPRNAQYPDGPRLFSRLLTRQIFGTKQRQSPAEFMLQVAREHGDLTHYVIAGRHFYQFNHPDLIADFFTADAPHHHRNIVMQRSRDVLGNGLLTSEEPVHMRQRRLAQPAFLRSRIAGYADVIAAMTETMMQRWRSQGASGTVRDVHRDMLELALRIVGKCLFDLDEIAELPQMESAVSSFMYFMPLSFLPFSRWVQASPLPSMRTLRAGQRYLDALIYGLIAERRRDPRDRGDLLSMLLSATDAEGGEAMTMTDTQLRDECVTIILAGHETTANALSFALHLLAQHPGVQQRLRAEALTVLGEERSATAEDYPKLKFATQVFAEAMRLYPPVWVTARTCAEPYRVAGFNIPAGAMLNAPQYAVHRDPRWWPEPDRFDPDRFTDEARQARPRYAYFPFGGGSRQCIAEGLAWMEGTLVLAMLSRRWNFSPGPDTPPEPRLKASVSLRPANGVPLHIDRRCAV